MGRLDLLPRTKCQVTRAELAGIVPAQTNLGQQAWLALRRMQYSVRSQRTANLVVSGARIPEQHSVLCSGGGA